MHFLWLLVTALGGISKGEFAMTKFSHHNGIIRLDFGINGAEKLDEVKKTLVETIRKFIKNDPANFIQRTQSHSKNILTLNAIEMTDWIRDEVESLVFQLGIAKVNRLDEAGRRATNSSSAMQFTWASATDILNIIKYVIAKIHDHLNSRKYRQQGYIASRYQLPELESSPNQLKLMNDLGRLEDYTVRFFGCFSPANTLQFNIIKAFDKITKFPPEETAKIVERRLKRQVPKHPRLRRGLSRYSELQALICRGLVEVSQEQFISCLKQLEAADHCTLKKLDRSHTHVDKFIAISTRNLIENIDKLDTGCKAARSTQGFQIICNETIGDESSKKLDTDKNPTNSIFQESIDMLNIYEQGRKKLQLMEKNGQHGTTAYQEFSKLLDEYKENLIDLGIRVLKQVHQGSKNILKIFVNSRGIAAERSRFYGVAHYPRYIERGRGKSSSAITKINESADSGTDYSYDDSCKSSLRKLSTALRVYSAPSVRGKFWIQSLNDVARVESHRGLNTILKLANTFLLATMFYECIVILAAVISRTETTERPTLPVDNENDFSDSYEDYEEERANKRQ